MKAQCINVRDEERAPVQNGIEPFEKVTSTYYRMIDSMEVKLIIEGQDVMSESFSLCFVE